MTRPMLLAAAIVVSIPWHPAAQPAHPASGARLAGAEAPGASPQAVDPLGLIRYALRLVGTPYVSGGDSVDGVDCSGLVSLAFRRIALELPGSVDRLYRLGSAALAPLHLGDLLFFDTTEGRAPLRATHLGIYAGDGRVVHAASEGSRRGVIVSALADPYYRERFLGARRVFPWPEPLLTMALKDQPLASADPSVFPSHEPLTIRVYNEMTGGGPMDLGLLEGGKLVLSRRIAPTAGRPALVQIVPEVGAWTVTVRRIFKGRVLGTLEFRVVE
jgi:hypothetical protein